MLRLVKGGFATVLVLWLAACGGDPIDPSLIGAADEIPPGPGILTGESGALEYTF